MKGQGPLLTECSVTGSGMENMLNGVMLSMVTWRLNLLCLHLESSCSSASLKNTAIDPCALQSAECTALVSTEEISKQLYIQLCHDTRNQIVVGQQPTVSEHISA